jgi:hypothetical protein
MLPPAVSQVAISKSCSKQNPRQALRLNELLASGCFLPSLGHESLEGMEKNAVGEEFGLIALRQKINVWLKSEGLAEFALTPPKR